MNENQNQFSNSPEQLGENLNNFTSPLINTHSFSTNAGPSGPEVKAVEVNYLSKDQILQMIRDYTGTNPSTLGAAFYSVGVGLIANAIKARAPQLIAGLLIVAGSVIAVGQLVQQIANATPSNQLQQILIQLVENSKQFSRIKVTVTTWQEYHVGPTTGYWTYYTTTSYQAV